ncbi:hypothetical protein Tco_0756298, partial [Tanacetum coccineum]
LRIILGKKPMEFKDENKGLMAKLKEKYIMYSNRGGVASDSCGDVVVTLDQVPRWSDVGFRFVSETRDPLASSSEAESSGSGMGSRSRGIRRLLAARKVYGHTANSPTEDTNHFLPSVLDKDLASSERGSIGDVGVGEDADEFSKGVRATEEDNSGTTQFELVFTFSVALRLNQTCCQLRNTHGGQFTRSGGEQSAARLLRDHVLIGHSSSAFGILCKQARWPVATKTASGSLLAKRMLVSLSHDQTNGVEDQKEASIGPG